MNRIVSAVAVAAFCFGATERVCAQDILRMMYSPVPIFNWTGFYVGGNAGYGWAHVDASASSVLGSASAGFNMKGMIAGAQLGAQLQSDRWVFGIESDFQGSWQKLNGVGDNGNVAVLNASVGSPGSPISETDKIDWFGTTRVRVGVAEGPALIYATGGVAYASVKTQASASGISIISGGDKTRFGWAAGGGLEFMIGKNWTIRGEYLYLDFGGYTDRYIYSGTVPGTPVDLHQRVTDQIVRVGVNYFIR